MQGEEGQGGLQGLRGAPAGVRGEDWTCGGGWLEGDGQLGPVISLIICRRS